MLDTLVRGALVFDGSGKRPETIDVGIRDGRFAALGDLRAEKAVEEIDGRGRWLAPGFLDLHTHYDLEIEVAPGLPESVRHGVTTAVVGNCSLSATLGNACDLADIFQRVETLPPELIRAWLGRAEGRRSPRAYLEHLESLPLGPRIAPLVGHSTLRAYAMGLDRAVSAEPAPERLYELIKDCLELGFLGVSIDRMPWHLMSGRHAGRRLPSHTAPFSECRRIADLCRRHEAILQMTPNPQSRPSILQLLALCTGILRRPLRATVVGAFDVAAMPHVWRLWSPLLKVMNDFLGGNLRLQTLPVPLVLYSDGPVTALFDEFPAGVRLNDCADRESRRRLLADPEFRERFRRDWKHSPGKTFHRDLSRIHPPAKHLDEFLDRLLRDDVDHVWHTTLSNHREGPRRKLLADPYILPGIGDSGAHLRNFAYNDGALALLSDGGLPPERAIRRVTGEPAEWLGLDTGTIALHRAADWVLIRPEHLGPSRMVRQANGHFANRRDVNPVERVAIGGRTAVRDGEPTPELGREKMGGVALRRPRPAPERYRVGSRSEPHRLATYWEVFVMKHRHPANVVLHCVGVAILIVIPLLAVRNPLWLFALPASQLVGLLGHALFERSPIDRRDAVFSVRAVLCLFRLFVRTLSGKYFSDVRNIFSKLALLGFFLSATAPAVEQDFAFILENDHPRFSLWGSDHGYSSGVGVYYGRTTELERLDSLAQGTAVTDSTMKPSWSWALGLGQQIYTPDDITNRALIVNDRPYAGWLYGSFLLNARTRHTLQGLTIELGVVGPAALGRQAQNFVHSVSGVRQALGWDNQLKNEPGVVVAYRQRVRVYEFLTARGTRLFDVAPSGIVALGNVATYACAGGRMRFGYGLADHFGPPGLESGAATYAPFAYANEPESSWELSGYMGYIARLVLRDIFLDGNTFASSHRIDRRYWGLEFEAGLTLRISPVTFTWRYTQSTTAFDGDNRFQFVGAFQIQVRF